MYFHKKFHLYVKGIPFSRFFVSFPTFSASFTFRVPTFFPFLFIPVLKMKHCKHDLSFYLLGHNSNVYFVPNHCQNVHRANLIHAEVISEKRITRIILTNDVSWGCEIENVGIQIDVTYHYTLNKSYLRSSDRGLRRCNNNHRNKRCDN